MEEMDSSLAAEVAVHPVVEVVIDQTEVELDYECYQTATVVEKDESEMVVHQLATEVTVVAEMELVAVVVVPDVAPCSQLHDDAKGLKQAEPESFVVVSSEHLTQTIVEGIQLMAASMKAEKCFHPLHLHQLLIWPAADPS
jgi:hypothetical protein